MNRCVAPCLMAIAICMPLRAGDLNPPAGLVGATMRSLDQIEPRIAINDLPGDQTATHVIPGPGSYFLTGDIVGEVGKHGLRIDTIGLPPGEPIRVTIDGNNFSMHGVQGSLDGVHSTGSPTRVEVRILRTGINAWGGDGMHMENISGLFLNEVSSSDNGGDGIRALVPQAAGTYVFQLTVSDASGNGGNGINIEGWAGGASSVEIIRCMTNGNTLDGCRILTADSSINESTSSDNGGHGYFSSDDDLCHLWGAASMAMRNGGDGFHFVDIDPILNHCVSLLNSGDGIEVASDTPTEEQFVNLFDSICAKNGGDGVRLFDVGASMSYCSMIANTGHGVSATTTDPAAGGERKAMMQWHQDCKANDGDGIHTVGMDVGIEHSSCTENLGNGGSFDDGVINTFEWRSIRNGTNGMVASNASIRVRGGALSENMLAGALVRDVRDGSLDGVDASGNGGSGITADSAFGESCGSLSLTGCVTNNNTSNGIALLCTTGGLVRRCESSNNGGDGVNVTGLGHVVIENVASGNTGAGFVVPTPDNTVATIVDEVGAETNTNPGANYVR